MTRALMPGRWSADRSRTIPNCNDCDQGRRPERCECRLYVLHPHLHRVTLTEIDDETAFPIERTFRGMTTAQKQAERERKANALKANGVAVFWTVMLAALCAALMTGMKG